MKGMIINSKFELPKYFIGLGDRFAHEAEAQLSACTLARKAGVFVTPGLEQIEPGTLHHRSEPSGTRVAADKAVLKLRWTGPYFLDADHINLKTVERFVEPCDFWSPELTEEGDYSPLGVARKIDN